MKSLFLYLPFCLLAFECKDDASDVSARESLQSCDLKGQIEIIESKQGTIIYTDSLLGLKLSAPEYFIFTASATLPLSVCNPPSEGYAFVKLNDSDSMTIIFSGKREILPPTADAFSELIEITGIELPADN